MEFAGAAGRLRPALSVSESAQFDGGYGQAQPEGAVHYGDTLGALYVGWSWFRGYRPEPDFGVVSQGLGAAPILEPEYHLEQQGGLEAQWTLDQWTFKTEEVARFDLDGQRNSRACGVGAEYSLGTLFEGGPGLTLLAEYDADERPQSLVVPFTNDLFFGGRLPLNDSSSTEFSVWCAWDQGLRRPVAAVADLSKRLLDRLKISLGYRGIYGEEGPFGQVDRDSQVFTRADVYF
jgi:hypothetical protein